MGEAKRRKTPPTGDEWKNTFRVGIYTCEMTYRPGSGLKAEWRPDMPKHLSADSVRYEPYHPLS